MEMGRDQAWLASIPDAVREAILRRISRLSETCKQMLRTAAVIGRDFDLPLLRALSLDISEDELLAGLDEALAVRVVESLSDGSGRYRFGHPLIHQAAYEEIPPMRRAQAHGAVGSELEQLHQNNLDEHAAQLAHHFAEAEAVLGPDKLVHYSLLAGQRALATYAWEEALEHFQLGLTSKGVELKGIKPAPDQIAAELLFGLGRAQLATGELSRSNDGVTSFTRAFDHFVSSGEVERATAIAEYPLPLNAGYVTGVGQLITRGLALVPADSLQAGRLQASFGRSKGLEEVDYEAANRAFSTALDIARRHGDAGLELQTLSFACDVDGYHLRLAEALGKGLRAVELASRIDNPRAELMARVWCYFSLSTTGKLGDAAGHAAAMLPLWERLRHPQYGSRALWAATSAARLVGNFDSARGFSNQGLTAAPRDPRLLLNRVLLEYDLGNFEEGRSYLDQFVKIAKESVPGPNTERALLAIGIPAVIRITGVADLAPIAEQNIKAILDSATATPGNSAFARVGGALLSAIQRDSVTAQAHYIALSESPASEFGSGMGFPRGRLLGLMAYTLGLLEQAVVHFDDGLIFCRTGGYKPALAWSCYDYAVALLEGSGYRSKAIDLLDESLNIASELAMKPLMERVFALQERAMAQPAPVPVYPDGLTQREVEVLRLVGTGKTDREIAEKLFISTATVSTHVRNLLNKTGVANRTEATAYAGRQGLI